MDKRVYDIFRQTLGSRKKASSKPTTNNTRMDGGSYTGGMLLRDDLGALVRVGGRGTVRNFQAAASNPWIQHVKRFAAQNGLTYAESVTKARASYTPQPGFEKRRLKAAPYQGRKNPRPKGRVTNRQGVKRTYVRAPRESDYSAARLAVLARARAKAAANRRR